MVDEMELKDLLKWLFQVTPRSLVILLVLSFLSPGASAMEPDPSETRMVEFEASRRFPQFSNILDVLSSGLNYWDHTLEENVGAENARTFGRPIKKLQGMLLPVMFKLGVISTIIFMTFLLALKSVAILSLLLMFQVAGAVGKIGLLLKLKGHGHEYQAPPQYWAPPPHYPPASGYSEPGHKEVHLHVHNSPSQSSHSIQSNHPQLTYGPPESSGWSRGDIADLSIPPVQYQNNQFTGYSRVGAQLSPVGSWSNPMSNIGS